MSTQLQEMINASSEAHLATIESLNQALGPLVDEMHEMMQLADTSFGPVELMTVRSHLASAANYTELIAFIKSANLLRANTMSTQQTAKQTQLMADLAVIEQDMTEAVDELQLVMA